MTTNRPIKLLMGSDFHFGVGGISPSEMVHAFTKTIFPLIPEVDLFCINGDFFDDSVIFDSRGFDPIYELMFNILKLCEKHQTKLRVLQGTWSHDRNQCQKFDLFYRVHGFTFDFRMVEVIDFEEIQFKDRSLRFMYVPDDIGYATSEAALAAITDKMYSKGWDYVDYGCMHDFFDFTYPKNIPINRRVYREDQFGFVRKAIDVGHVHQHRVGPLGFAYSNGSFDRTTAGDEDPKGLILFTDNVDGYKAQFIENKLAAVFDTLLFKEEDDTETIRNAIIEHLAKIKTERQINLRFIIASPDQWAAIVSWFKEHRPDVKITSKKLDKSKVNPVRMMGGTLTKKSERPPVPTRDNLPKMIREGIDPSYSMDEEKIRKYLGYTPNIKTEVRQN